MLLFNANDVTSSAHTDDTHATVGTRAIAPPRPLFAIALTNLDDSTRTTLSDA